ELPFASLGKVAATSGHPHPRSGTGPLPAVVGILLRARPAVAGRPSGAEDPDPFPPSRGARHWVVGRTD
ncbi:hypothetical protein, partial [Streptomyces sp. NPDC056069]|uniref:hypothetical protein n=1 Tax=Streptomyces sp. NPDC056069 TaxID=3345702 RepID=UPI0035E2EAEC